MRPHDGSETVVGVADAGAPLAHGFGYSVLKGGGACFDRHYRCPKEAHPVYIKSLSYGVLLAHKHNAFHAHEGRGGSCGNSMLSGAGLSYETGLAHFFGKQGLSENVVDLVGAGVV